MVSESSTNGATVKPVNISNGNYGPPIDPITAFLNIAKKSPEKTFISQYIESEERVNRISITQVAERAASIRDFLDAGESRNDGSNEEVIGLHFGLESDFYPALMACWASGRPFAVIPSAWSAPVASQILDRLGITRILWQSMVPNEDFVKSLAPKVKFYNLSEVETNKSCAPLSNSKLPKTMLYMHTSGSTGTPKSIVLLRETLMYQGTTLLTDPNKNLFTSQGPLHTICIAPPHMTMTLIVFILAPYTLVTIHLPPIRKDSKLLPGVQEASSLSRAESIAYSVLHGLDLESTEALWTTPTLLQMVFATLDDKRTFPHIKRICFGGEAFTKQIWHETRRRCPNAVILNLYGATEGTMMFLANPFFLDHSARVSEKLEEQRVGIYRVTDVWGVGELVLLDREGSTHMVPKKAGNVGLLAAIPAIPGVIGYMTPPNPGAEFKKKAQETFPVLNGKLSVNYGDLAEWVPLPEEPTQLGLRIIGREQGFGSRRVKVNGVWVSLELLEDILRGICENHSEVAIVALENSSGQVTGLAGFYEEDGRPTDSKDTFRAANEAIANYQDTKLSVRLAALFNIPKGSLPVNSNGKRDWKLIQKMASTRLADHGGIGSDIPPEDSTAIKISQKLVKMLGGSGEALKGKDVQLGKVGVDSIKVVTLANFIRSKFSVNVKADDLLAGDMTVVRLARMIEKMGSKGDDSITVDLMKEVEILSKELPTPSFTPSAPESLETVFLTGSSGFLGTHILRQVLIRHPDAKIFLHVRASSPETAKERVITVAQKAHWWSDHFLPRLEFWCGDLAKPNLGLSSEKWESIGKMSGIIHNGAQVHWIKDYFSLKPANTLSTLQLLKTTLTNKQAPKFVLVSGGGQAIFDSRIHGDTHAIAKAVAKDADGYTQGKFVAEQLKKHANTHTGTARIVRPGFIVGTSQDGVANLDDFVWRLTASCIELKSYAADNTDGWMPIAGVDRVAEVTVQALESEKSDPKITRPVPDGLTFGEFWGVIRDMGYDLEGVSRQEWLKRLQKELDRQGETHILWPLIGRLQEPMEGGSAPEPLGDERMAEVREIVRKNVKYLVSVGFAEGLNGEKKADGADVGFQRTKGQN